jgi:hypothetical protein
MSLKGLQQAAQHWTTGRGSAPFASTPGTPAGRSISKGSWPRPVLYLAIIGYKESLKVDNEFLQNTLKQILAAEEHEIEDLPHGCALLHAAQPLVGCLRCDYMQLLKLPLQQTSASCYRSIIGALMQFS